MTASAAPLETVTLHTIEQAHATEPPTRELMERYSEYKYGSPDKIDAFAQELVGAIATHLELDGDEDNWVIVTPPFRNSGLPSAIVAVAEEVSTELGVPYARSYTEREDELVLGRYTGLDSLEARLADRRKTQTHFDIEEGGLEGKDVIILDDIHVTGSTVDHLREVLDGKKVRRMSAFVLVHLVSDSPTFEETVNTALLDDLPRFLEGRNHPDWEVNRRTFKQIYKLPDEDFPTVINGLSSSSLHKLIDAAALYVKDGQDTSRLDYMKLVARLANSHSS